MTTDIYGADLNEGDKVMSQNGRTGVIVKRGKKFKTSQRHQGKYTTIDDTDGLLDTIVMDREMIRI